MIPIELARSLSQEGRVQEIGAGPLRLFRVWDEHGTRLVKVYPGTASQRREQAALAYLRGLAGVPAVIDHGCEGELAWMVFADPGPWSLASLPGPAAACRRAGELLRRVHEADHTGFSNLTRGIDQARVDADYPSVFHRLERYRAKLHLPLALIEKAAANPPPLAGVPRVAHTDPAPERFLTGDDGAVTLMHWERSTLAAPEWDITRAAWLFRLRCGNDAAAALLEGYGAAMEPTDVRRWSIFHAGMMLLELAESSDRPAADELIGSLRSLLHEDL